MWLCNSSEHLNPLDVIVFVFCQWLNTNPQQLYQRNNNNLDLDQTSCPKESVVTHHWLFRTRSLVGQEYHHLQYQEVWIVVSCYLQPGCTFISNWAPNRLFPIFLLSIANIISLIKPFGFIWGTVSLFFPLSISFLPSPFFQVSFSVMCFLWIYSTVYFCSVTEPEATVSASPLPEEILNV